MKLLIITQVVDKEHPVLGFFHRWIEEFSVNCEQVSVICLQSGSYNFPENVKIYSLGKEEGNGRFHYLVRFYTLIWQLRNEYDRVFIHMNQLYVILGAPVWRLLGKQISLWYMHGAVPFSLRVAEVCTNKIFTGSAESFRLKSNKVSITGHGIDTDLFAPTQVSKTIDLVTVGRITKSKNLFAVIDALSEIRKKHTVTLTIVGEAITEAEREYFTLLKQYIDKYGLSEAVIFTGKVVQTDLPGLLNQAKLFVTTAKNGSLDKAVLEAMACGLPVVSMAPGVASLPLGTAQTNDLPAFVSEVLRVLESGMYTQPQYVDYIARQHSLTGLIPKILY